MYFQTGLIINIFSGHLVIPLRAIRPGLCHGHLPWQRSANGCPDHRPPGLHRVGPPEGQAASHGRCPETSRPETEEPSVNITYYRATRIFWHLDDIDRAAPFLKLRKQDGVVSSDFPHVSKDLCTDIQTRIWLLFCYFLCSIFGREVYFWCRLLMSCFVYNV